MSIPLSAFEGLESSFNEEGQSLKSEMGCEGFSSSGKFRCRGLVTVDFFCELATRQRIRRYFEKCLNGFVLKR